MKFSFFTKGSILLYLYISFVYLTYQSYGAKTKTKSSYVTGDIKVEYMQSHTKNGIVPLSTATYKKYILKPDRPFHTFVVFTALSDKYNCEICRQVHPQYELLAKSYSTAREYKLQSRDGLEVFFVLVDFEANNAIFSLYGYTSAPHVAYIAPDLNPDEGKKIPNAITIPSKDLHSIYSDGRQAEDFARFVKRKTGFEFEIQRSKRDFYLNIATVVIVLLYLTKLAISKMDVLITKFRRKRVWMCVSLMFYGFSVSGMVYCIIRSSPAYSRDRSGAVKYFHPQGRQQYVYEGIIIGAFDIIAATCIILLSQWALYIKQSEIRIAAVGICTAGFILAYRFMISCYTFKNPWYTGWMGF